MATTRAVVVKTVGGPLELVPRELPAPGPGEVRLRVEACGICHSDMYAREGTFPGVSYPRVPGHEVAGVIEEVGPGVTGWREGERAGVGWFGGCCGACDRCRRGDFILCRAGAISGITRDGGYAEHMLARAEALARLPDALGFAEAAPILCAGITTYNALRRSEARPGDLVAIQGIGGLGHLGVQFAAKMGFETVAIGRGPEKEPFARRLGAAHYIDAAAGSPADALGRLGGARVILATAPSGRSITPLIDGLAPGGELIVVGASPEPIEVTPLQLIGGRRTVRGWPSGAAADSEDALRFCAVSGVRPLVEKFPLARAAEAYERAMAGRARFRVVLTTR
jgi:D-arabinose 1-dehydrogenase-like Zn-dependent alcohol dehydrogenase